jgi:hypothetical protein
MFVIALDPATNTGLCEGFPGRDPLFLAQRLQVSPQDEHEDIYGRAHHWFSEHLTQRMPDAVAIEAPILVTDGATNNDALNRTRGLYAVFAGAVKARGIRLLRVEVKTWRKYFLGRGNLARPLAKAECVRICNLLDWHPPSIDAAEAAGIWAWSCSQLEPQSTQRIEPLFLRTGA